MLVKLTNGITSVTLETLLNNTPGNSSWVFKTYNVASLITPTANMHLTVETSDIQPSSIVEGGLDEFSVTDNGVGVNELSSLSFAAYPNPFSNELLINGGSLTEKISSIEIYNSMGEKVFSENNIHASQLKINTSAWAAGLYVVRVAGEGAAAKNTTVSKVY